MRLSIVDCLSLHEYFLKLYATVFTLMNTLLSTHARDGVCFPVNSAAFAVYDAFCRSVGTEYAAVVSCMSVAQQYPRICRILHRVRQTCTISFIIMRFTQPKKVKKRTKY